MAVKIDNNIDGIGKWSCTFNSSGTGDMAFSLNDKILLKSDGVELGMLKEINGMEIICRSHFSNKTGWNRVETETLHPFGFEPVIKRKWEQAVNHIRVVSDIIIPGSTPLNHITIDSLQLPGKWNKVVAFSQLSPETTEVSIEEIDLTDFSGKEKKFNHIPIVLLFVDENRTELEIGTGYDLWRWHEFPSRFGGNSEFTLKGTNEGLLFERKVLVFDKDHEIGRNNFRVSWYFAWYENGGDDIKKACPGKYNSLMASGKKLQSNNMIDSHIYCLDKSTWPETALVEGVSGKYPCFCSRQTTNYLRHWFRSLCNGAKEDIFLCNTDSRICTNATHMMKGKRKNIVHWDYFYLMGFWEWANKHLGSTDIYFYIIFDKHSIFADLPSARGMGHNVSV